MNSEEFIRAIKMVVTNATIKDVLENLIEPPGKSPDKKLMELSTWYNQLDETTKSYIYEIIQISVDSSVFGFLCVLDGVRAIENVGNKGDLELYYLKDGLNTLLNNPKEGYLHDIYDS